MSVAGLRGAETADTRDAWTQGAGWRGPLTVCLVFLLGALATGWPWLLGIVTIPWDSKATFLPQVQFLAQSLAAGESPAWLPYIFSGHPQIADPQSMIFSPPFLVLALVSSSPSIRAVDATVLGMIAVSGLVLIAWFRDKGWHWAGGLIAALAFCYGGSMAWRVQHTGQVLSLAYLPIVLLLLDRALTRGSLLYGLVAGFAAGFMLLGRDQVALLGIYMLAGYAVVRIWSSDAPANALKAAVGPGLAGAAACALLIGLPLLMTAELAATSNRPSIDFAGAARGSLHPGLLLTFVAPNLYGAVGRMADYWGPPSFAWQGTDLFIAQNMGVMYLGALPLILIAFAALRGDLWRAEIRFFTVALLILLMYALGKYTPVFQAFHALVPGVSLYRRPADATFMVGAVGAILAGYAVHRLIRDPFADTEAEPRNVVLLGVFFAAACGLAYLAAFMADRLGLVQKPIALAVVWFGAAAAALMAVRPNIDRKPLAAAVILGTLLSLDLAFNNGPSSSTALPLANYDVLEPETKNETIAVLKAQTVRNETRRDRIELAGLGFHWPNASMTHQLENTLGYDPVRLQLYSAAVGAEDHVGLPEQRVFSPLFPSYKSALANLLGLRFIATGVPIEAIDKTLKPGDLRQVAQTADGFIYENASAFDRVHFAARAEAADFTRMIADGKWPDVDLTQTVLLAPAAARFAPEGGTGRVRISAYHHTEVVLDVESDKGGWAVLNDLWHPWWEAELDGFPVPVLRANVLFRAVAVPPGRHRLVYTFRPLTGAWRELPTFRSSQAKSPQ